MPILWLLAACQTPSDSSTDVPATPHSGSALWDTEGSGAHSASQGTGRADTSSVHTGRPLELPCVELEWVVHMQSTDSDGGTGVLRLEDSDVLFGGYFARDLIIGVGRADEATLEESCSSVRPDGLLARFGPDGSLRWTATMEGCDSAQITDMALGVDAHVFVSGTYTDTVTLGAGEPGEVTLETGALGDDAVFLAKYATADGTLVWARNVGASPTRTDSGTKHLAVADDGTLYLAGDFRNSMVFDQGLPSEITLDALDTGFEGTYDAWLAAFTAAGEVRWAQVVGGADDRQYPNDLSVGDGRVVMALDSSGGPMVFGADTDAEVVLEPEEGARGPVGSFFVDDGSLDFAFMAPGLDAYRVRARPGGYLLGGNTYNVDTVFAPGATNETVLGPDLMYVASYTWDNELQWVTGTVEGTSWLRAMTVDHGRGALGGSVWTMSFENGIELQTTGSHDGLVALFDPASGRFGCAWSHFGGEDDQFVQGIALGPDGEVYVTGHFKGPTVFAAGTPQAHHAESSGGNDIALMKFRLLAP